MGDDEDSTRKPNVYRILARNLSPCARHRDRRASPGATSQGGASASLPDVDVQDPLVPAHKLGVSSPCTGEAWMRGDETPQASQVRLGVVPIDDRVGVPGVRQDDVDGEALHGLGRAAFDADDPHLYIDHSVVAETSTACHLARPASSVCFDHHLPLSDISRGREQERDAPQAIAAHLWDAAIRVDDAHAGCAAVPGR